MSVVQTLVPQPASPTFLQNDDISVSLEQMEEPVFDADGRNITSLRWIKTSQSEVSRTPFYDHRNVDSSQPLAAHPRLHQARGTLPLVEAFGIHLVVGSAKIHPEDAKTLRRLDFLVASFRHCVCAEARYSRGEPG